MRKNIDLILDVEGAGKYLEENKLWWFECEPYTMLEFEDMVKNGDLVIIEKKMINGSCDDGIAKDYREPCVKKYENGMCTTATYTGEHAQLWANARNICEIGMVKRKNKAVCPELDEIREKCDHFMRWILDSIDSVKELKVTGHNCYHAQYLYDIEKYLGKMEELIGDLEFELHWKILQIAERDEKVKTYIQDKKDED